MEASPEQQCNPSENDEYVLLDLENVCMQADIPANAPYTLSGLDTLNPTLTIGNHLKLIGEYQETIGTCFMFSQREDDETVVNTINSENGSSVDQQHKSGVNEDPCRQFRHVASIHKVLKFRLKADDHTQNV